MTVSPALLAKLNDGTILFNRKVKVTIATVVKSDDFASVKGEVVEITDLRVQFKITKTTDKHPNTAEVTITNLAKDTRSKLNVKGTKFIIQAGYGDTLGQLFVGDARSIDHKREGADWNTIIKSGDGERAFRFARVSESFKGGTKAADIVKTITTKLGLGMGNLNDKLSGMDSQYVNGYAAHGTCSAELDKILRSLGYEWSIQDGAPQFLKVNEGRTISIPDITPETGLIGSPEMGTPEKKGKPPLCKFKSLLNDKIKAGGVVRLKSERYDGKFRIKKLVHTGDTHGGDWYTECEGISQ